MSNNLSKLLILEKALEYLVKADTEREYLSPGEHAPEGLREYPGQKVGSRYYVPSEASQSVESDEPTDEREIEVVAPASPSKKEDSKTQRDRQILELSFSESMAQKGEHWIEGLGLRTVKGEVRNEELYEAIKGMVEENNREFDKVHKSLEKRFGADNQFLGSSIDVNKLIAENVKSIGYTNGEYSGEPSWGDSGVHADKNFTIMIDDKPFIYKAVVNENRAEELSYAIDRDLGLNIVPFVKTTTFDVKELYTKFGLTWDKSDSIGSNVLTGLLWNAEAGAGHLMEFCENCAQNDEERSEIIRDMLMTKEGRQEFIKLNLLDTLISNSDRHTGNWLVTKDRKILAIDSGFGAAHGGPTPYESPTRYAAGANWGVPEIFDLHGWRTDKDAYHPATEFVPEQKIDVKELFDRINDTGAKILMQEASDFIDEVFEYKGDGSKKFEKMVTMVEELGFNVNFNKMSSGEYFDPGAESSNEARKMPTWMKEMAMLEDGLVNEWGSDVEVQERIKNAMISRFGEEAYEKYDTNKGEVGEIISSIKLQVGVCYAKSVQDALIYMSNKSKSYRLGDTADRDYADEMFGDIDFDNMESGRIDSIPEIYLSPWDPPIDAEWQEDLKYNNDAESSDKAGWDSDWDSEMDRALEGRDR